MVIEYMDIFLFCTTMDTFQTLFMVDLFFGVYRTYLAPEVLHRLHKGLSPMTNWRRTMNMSRRNRLVFTVGLTTLFLMAMPLIALAEEEAEQPALYATWWSILPPLLAIALALITKEVYSSLFLGVLFGGILYAGASFSGVLMHVMVDGIIGSLADPYNMGIMVFLVILGILVSMMNRTGGSAAFGRWAKTKIKTRQGAQFSTIFLGILIFVDDYFNCLTVGSVMKPVTDEYNISRSKLAYLIDATAAPVCIIAPISSWAAAVSGYVEGANGFTVFVKSIPYNYYALLTIAMMFMIVKMNFDYGNMAQFERNAVESGDLFTVRDQNAIDAEKEEQLGINANGKVSDLVFPVVVLVIACVIGMLYSGGFFEGENVQNAFANCDASVGLSIGSITALVITIIYFCLRRIISFRGCMECVPEGFKSMVSPMMVLTLAWALKAMTDSLGLKAFVENGVKNMPHGLLSLLPVILFAIACVIAIASGTSWGTFGILIPVGLAITQSVPELIIPVIAACMAGAVCGDHCSPISDTTIMASAGAACNHISHVETQLPYAMTVAAVSAVCYVFAGFMRNPWIPLAIGLVVLYGVLRYFKSRETSYSPQAVNANETQTA